MAKGNGGSGSRGRPYGLMLLLAFGAALLGVMVIHKLRERRIFNLLVKEKDRDLLSLQLLLQKEREYSKGMKRKTEDMKAKIYSLRNQKMELDRKILEMQSTIDSLKDEQKVMESAIEEKQSEILVLRDANIDAQKENPEMVSLTESLKLKEAEIEDLKQRLENSVKVWSVSADDPSNSNVNVARNIAYKENMEVGESKGVELHESTNQINGENSTSSNGTDNASNNPGSKNREVTIDAKEASRQQSNMQEDLVRGLENKNATNNLTINDAQEIVKGSSRSNGAVGTEEEHNIANAAEAALQIAEKVSKNGADNDVKSVTDEERNIHRDVQNGLENSRQELGQDHQEDFKDGMKLEMVGREASWGRRKHEATNGAKAQRWRMLARKRKMENNENNENNGAESMRNVKLGREEQDGMVDRREATTEIYQKGERSANGSLDGKLDNASSDTEKQNLDGVQHEDQEVNGLRDSSNSTGSRKIEIRGEQAENEDQKVNDIRENSNSNYTRDAEIGAERAKGTGKLERPEDRDHERDADSGDLYRDSVSDLEEYKEEFTEETDESEF